MENKRFVLLARKLLFKSGITAKLEGDSKMNDTLRKAKLLSWGAVLLALQGPAAVTASGFKLAGPDNGGVTLSWTVSGSAGGMFGGMYYLNGTYNVAVTRGTSSSQSAQSRIIVAGETSGAYMTQQNTNSGHVTDTPPATGQTYYYWLHYAPYSIIDDSANFFACYLGGSYSTIRSASCIGPISVFVPAPGPKKIKVTFNSNGGNGEMAEQEFESGVPQKLEKNHFSRDGYVFQGWSTAASGEEVEYQDEQEITVDSDMPLYAVWANPPLTLSPESADWAKGSITLKCEDADTSDTEHKYTLSYYDEDTDEWIDVDGAKERSAGADGNAHLSDGDFSSRLGGIPTVKYHVSDENGRVSNECVTRNRHGLFVGVGEYESYEERELKRLPDAASDASRFKRIAEEYAKFIGPVYANQDATIDTVDTALDNFAESSQVGDICLFYVTTHGGYDGNDGSICLYDGDYAHSALTKKVSRMASKGIAFIAVVGTCHGEAMLQMDFPNAAIVAAATMKDLSDSTFDEILMDDGWEGGCAATGPTMTFENLADYAIERYNGLFGGIDFVDETTKECYPYRMSATKNDVGGLLGKIVARAGCTSVSDIAHKPSVVTGFSATTDDSARVTVSWNAVQGADCYYLFYGRLGDQHFLGYIEVPEGTSYTFGSSEDWVKESSKVAPIQFMVKAYNAAGAGPAAVTSGWRRKMFAVSFYTVDHERIEWDEPSFDRYNDDFIVKNVEYGDEYVLKCLPKVKKSGYYLKGWYDLNNNEAKVGLTLSSDAMYHAEWQEIAMPQAWLDGHLDIAERSGGDLATAAAMTAANGTRTVDECYRLGINPEDPNDDLKITDFKMEGGMPVVTLNHTEDGSGKSFLPRVKMLGKANLADAEWCEVPEGGDATMRFFKVKVEMP